MSIIAVTALKCKDVWDENNSESCEVVVISNIEDALELVKDSD